MNHRNIPAISIVIPMYNAEKYIGECLDSILAQTFDDYEVIVVDDCSTDNSAAIVESYVPKFTREGAEILRLIRSKVNSGGCAIPRNIGMRIACGKYLMFVDADDAITTTACEELYSIAIKFDADVVSCDRYYAVASSQSSRSIRVANLTPMTYLPSCRLVTEPSVIIDNFEGRLIGIQQRQFIWNAWMKLIRRDSIMENNLEMIGIGAEDMVFTYCLLCSVRSYVRVPNVIYLYRMTDGSITRSRTNTAEIVSKWITMLIDAIGYMDKFLDRQKFFKGNINAKYAIFDAFTTEFVKYLIPVYAKIPAHELDEFVRQALSNAGNINATMAFVFARMNIFNVNLIQQNQLIQQYQQQIQQLQSQIQQLQQLSTRQFNLDTEDIFK